MRYGFLFSLGSVALAFEVAAQSAVDVARPEQRQKERRAVEKVQEKRAKHASIIEFRGEQAFNEKDLRSALKEEITTIEDFGLSPARADDLAFFLEVFYRKHGYTKVNVHYVIESSDRLRLDITEGPRFMLQTVVFDGNTREPADKLFEYMVGPTRERYSRLDKRLPFVAADMQEGTHLVQRFYIAEGFLDAVVDPPRYKFQPQSDDVDVVVPIHEGRQYSFGHIVFTGQTVYGAEALRPQLVDLLQRPYTGARVEDIPRRLEAYFKARGYYDVKVVANGAPEEAVGGRVPVHVVISAGPVYHFDGVTVNGLRRLHPGFVTKRFTRLNGKTYSPDVLNERFRTLMKTGQFNLLQIKPVPVDGHLLRLDIAPEEAVGGRVPVHVVISAGPVYHFDGVTVNGLRRLHPGFVTKRFTRLNGKTYSPDVLNERFRTLMKTGQFNLLQIKPVPVDGHLLRLDISAEEAKSREFGFWVGFDTYEGALAGVQLGDRDLFGYGRPLTVSIEVSQRSYRGDILYEDPFFFDTDFYFKARGSAFTFDYDGYTKFEVGGRFELSRKITKNDEAALILSIRHVKITDSEIRPDFLLGPREYQVDTIGLSNTLDMRESPYVNPRGFLVINTLDVASSALGSDIEYIRGTMRVGYYL
ncbi:MAG: hypothetical protein DME82_03730, partial [Verrucomicrobia bacterium]